MAALLQLIPEPGLSWAAFFSRGRNACGEWKERRAQRRLVGRHVSFHSGSYQSSRIREQLLADISVDHLVQPPLPKQSHQEPIAQDHVQVTLEDFQGGTPNDRRGQSLPALSHPSVSPVPPSPSLLR